MKNYPNILITLCARGGSKGIPGKNVKVMNGKPVIAYSIEHAKILAKKINATIELSTDSESIKEIAAQYGIITNYTRPDHLATDGAGKIDVLIALKEYAEAVNAVKYDLLIDLDVSSPLRTVAEVLEGIELLDDSPKAVNLFSVSHAHRNPYFNMVEKGDDGFFHLIKKGEFKTRQESPAVYDLNGSFYIYRDEFFAKGYRGAITDRSIVFPMKHICFDLDETIDFAFMSFLLEQRKLDFDFNY